MIIKLNKFKKANKNIYNSKIIISKKLKIKNNRI